LQNDLFAVEERLDIASGDITEQYANLIVNTGVVSCDLETSGLDWKSQRIGLVQLYCQGTDVTVFKPIQNRVPARLVRLVGNPKVQKIFHHAMFDLRFIAHHWNAKPANIVCTKIASKILDPERKDHSLATLLKAHLEITVDKSVQKSDWLTWNLSELQMAYAKADVANLQELYDLLAGQLKDCGKLALARHCFSHLPTRVQLELGNYGDVFAY
jgi:ribonuclease D